MLILKELNRLLNDEEGLTTVEYAVAGALVAAGVVTAFTNLGTNVQGSINELCDAVGKGVSGGAATCAKE
ncbi:Flp family type IVb pilin [Oceanisphaera sp. KMM 10153]|uniref:Flp family type IVb pilin n=1 Tax=Oceanisphaera submarina TaxID=3390193 RepID=UPI003975AC51